MTYIEEAPQPSVIEIQIPGAMPQAVVEQDLQPFWKAMNQASTLSYKLLGELLQS